MHFHQTCRQCNYIRDKDELISFRAQKIKWSMKVVYVYPGLEYDVTVVNFLQGPARRYQQSCQMTAAGAGSFLHPISGVITPQLSYNTPRDSSSDTPPIAHSSYFGHLHTRGLPGLTPTLRSTSSSCQVLENSQRRRVKPAFEPQTHLTRQVSRNAYLKFDRTGNEAFNLLAITNL